jgi:hypothetical protein
MQFFIICAENIANRSRNRQFAFPAFPQYLDISLICFLRADVVCLIKTNLYCCPSGFEMRRFANLAVPAAG